MILQSAPSGAPDHRPIPFDIRIRYWTLPELYNATDSLIAKAQACSRNNDPAGTEEAERRCDAVWDELDRRLAVKAERERKRQARMRKEADAWYAAQAAEAGK